MAQAEPDRGLTTPGPTDRSTQASASGSRFTNIRRFSVVDSTNRVAADAWRSGSREGLVVVADYQDAGRGRRGRSWLAPSRGALLFTVLFEPPFPLGSWWLVPGVLSLAILDAIGELATCDVALKWPNDLVCGGRKLAGILSEVVERPAGGAVERGLVVGAGVNLAWPAGWPGPEFGEFASTLAETATTLEICAGVRTDAGALLAQVIDSLDVRYGTLLAPGGFEAATAELRARCVTLGMKVRVTTERDEVVGEAVDIDASGRLVVATAGAVETFEVGDVVHLRRGAG